MKQERTEEKTVRQKRTEENTEEKEEKDEKDEKEKRNKRRIERWYIATRIVEVTCYAIVYEYTSKAYTV